MEYRQLGHSGLAVSKLGLGTNNFGTKLDAETCRAVTYAALDAGVTFIDTADFYGPAEERLGSILKGHRDDVVIASKFGSDVRKWGRDNGQDWNSRTSRRYIIRAVESSLRCLDTEWIDLYQLHKPDPRTPILETLEALDDLVSAGKIRYIGHSNLSGYELTAAEWTARVHGLTRFIGSQTKYNLLDRRAEREVVHALLDYGIGLIAYSPLADGLLTGKYRRGQPAPPGSRIDFFGRTELLSADKFDKIEAIEEFAAARGLSILDVALGGITAQPAVASAITGATSPEQIRANAAAVEWEPAKADLEALAAITPGSSRT